MAKKIDGFDWKTFKLTENVVGVAQNPTNYPYTEQIDNGFKRDLNLGGDISLNPVFIDDFIITYSKVNGEDGGFMRVYRYYEDIDYITNFFAQKQISESNTRYMAYSFVYFGEEFGIAFKIANSSLFFRFSVPQLNMATAVLEPNGMFSSENIAFLTLIQRREDPLTPATERRDVYGYFDNNYIYKFEADAVKNEIKAVETIELPKAGIQIFENRMIDIGRY